MKKIGVLLIILVCFVITASVAKDVIVKNAIEGIVSIATGLNMDIGALTISAAKAYIKIDNMVIFNPPHFDDKVMLDIPEIYIDYDLPALLKKNIHLYSMRINLDELTVIKDKGGKTNLDYLKGLKREKGGEQQKRGSRKTDISIDLLRLRIGKVIYKDYSAGGEPAISEYKVNIDSQYKNVRDAREILRIIVLKTVFNTAIGRLSDFRKFKEIGPYTIETGRDILKKTIGGLKGILESPFKKEPQDAQ